MDATTGTTGAGLFAWKAIGGLAGMGAIGAALAAIVVMCIITPRTRSEWVVGLISTVVGSISGGAYIILHFDLQHWTYSPIGLIATLGLVFACGLPAWATVRWCFNFFNARRQHDIKQIVDELRKVS